jgi:TolC family type I secretion outer membrane protein
MYMSARWNIALVVVTLSVTGAAHASSFEDALTSAYRDNPQIKAQRERLQATDESVAQAVSGFRPTIGANYNRGRQQSELGGTGEVTSTNESKSLRLEQPLFRGGGTWSSYQSALQQVKSGQYQLAAVEQSVMLSAVTAYMDVVSASAMLDLSRKNAGVLSEQLSAASTRFQVGEVTRTDVAQSEARLSDAKSNVIGAEGSLLSAMATYERVIGARPDGTLMVPDKLPELPISLDESLERARAANPELLSVIHSAKASDYDVRTSQAALLPRVSLVGSMSRQKGAGSNGNTDFDQDRIGVEVAIPLYQSGAEYSRVREASAVARQRDHESIDLRRGVDEAVTQAWEQLESAIATIGTRNEQIKAANLALEGVQQEQQYGSRTVLDVLDAEQELFGARTNLVRAQRDRIVAAYNLAFRLGQLTPQLLGLNVEAYDPQVHADTVGWKTIGF